MFSCFFDMALQTSLKSRHLFRLNARSIQRCFSEDAAPGGAGQKKGLVLGVYHVQDAQLGGEGGGEYKFTPTASAFNKQTGGRLEELIKEAGGRIPKGKALVYHNLDPEFFAVALSGLDKENAEVDTSEQLDEAKENVRVAAGVGAYELRKTGVNHILVESFNDQVEAAAEGAGLAVWRYQDNKAKEDQKPIPTLELYSDPDKTSWLRGINKADAQNFARKLSDSPPNLMTPSLFAKATVDALCPCGITVEIRDKEWIESKNMTAFLTVARGSCELPLLLELGYCGGGQEEKPIVLVGKGVTFDSGGLCLKPCKGMMEFRADMAGAAVIVATLRAISILNLPINVTGIIPLCENMPSGMAVKPGDLVRASNGRAILVDNTDREGELILADALLYGVNNFKPKMVMDIATLSPGMRTALGSAASGVFASTDSLWKEISEAGTFTGDRVWRFPLWKQFSNKVTHTTFADISNVGLGPGGDPCLAAAFLREFVPCGDWIHMDITGSGKLQGKGDVPYLVEGRMTGRPTRTVIQFLTQFAKTNH
ncbi:cytosol aminopeptidase-like [Periplaneta americana]|uniref:cytosol aminopeptidase-like n=1 Tax=Periplaneta americana TaxID=6978 RepID=UPI0037E7C7C8